MNVELNRKRGIWVSKTSCQSRKFDAFEIYMRNENGLSVPSVFYKIVYFSVQTILLNKHTFRNFECCDERAILL